MSIRDISAFNTGVDTNAPLKTLHHSHDAIVAQLSELAELPRLLEQVQRSRRIAASTVALFCGEVLAHHADEERELFPAVIRSAQAGEERKRVEFIAQVLSAEHRILEQMWNGLEPSVRAAARGRATSMDSERVAHLVRKYTEHARFEEEQFLPLAQAILERDSNHLQAVGLALHLSRIPEQPGYI
jgi:hemerythrin-like domain-containing protein